MRALLDINVLIALFDEDHTHHVETTGWLEENLMAGLPVLLLKMAVSGLCHNLAIPTLSPFLKSSRDCKKQFPESSIVLSRITSVF